MSKDRSRMISVLKEIVIPILRDKGFEGNFPHFRRILKDKIDLLTFQFDRHGGGFVVEIAKCDSKGITTEWGKKISPKKVRAWDVDERLRLGAKSIGLDCWFRYDKKIIFGDIYKKLAKKVVFLLESQAERYWKR